MSAVSPDESCLLYRKEEIHRTAVLYQRKVAEADFALCSPGFHDCHAFRSPHPLIVAGSLRLLKGETAFWLVARHARLQAALSSIIERNTVTARGPSEVSFALDARAALLTFEEISSVCLVDVLGEGVGHVVEYWVCRNQSPVVDLEDLNDIGEAALTDVARTLCQW